MDPNDDRHGTTAGHKAHRRAKEKPCEPCRRAMNEHKRQKRATGAWKSEHCPVCGKQTHGDLCRTCKTVGSVRTTDLDIDFDPPNWVRRGLIWVAA